MANPASHVPLIVAGALVGVVTGAFAGSLGAAPGEASGAVLGANSGTVSATTSATISGAMPDEPIGLALDAAPGSREPNLVLARDGTAYVSWLEPVGGERVALRFARRVGHEWSAPATIAEGDDWFVNWADFPGLAAFGERGLAAWWLVGNGDGRYAYDLRITLSGDGGESWGEPITPHRDGTPTQHGLPSLLSWPDGRLFVGWLDGRVNARGMAGASGVELPTGDMTLRSALVDADGRVSEETLVDESVCTCCATDAVRVGEGVLLAYRDRSAAEIRDISLRRHDGERWSDVSPLHRDGWRIEGCPINGAALASDGEERVAAAWFTAADDSPNLLFAWSGDGGLTFGRPVDVDDGRPIGRADVVLLETGADMVSWLENTTRGEELRYRLVRADGRAEPSRTIVHSRTGRTMGFPRMLADGDAVLFAWTDTSDGLAVRTAVVGVAGRP